ncbi:MAG: helix-turn-helix domain-containing protein [Parcubacteria group bacterium]
MIEQLKVVAADERTKGLKDTTVVPNEILRADLTPPLLSLWIHLWAHCYGARDNYCWPSRKRLAKQIGCSLRSVCTYLDRLETLGLISRVTHTEHGVSGYYIYCPIEKGVDEQRLPGGRANIAPGVRHR